jgi:hypothetical protein
VSAKEERLFDLVAETREKLRPFLVMEIFKTGTMPTTYLAVDTILQAAFEKAVSGEAYKGSGSAE